MASGDRIELLTSDTFEEAMSTVAQESSIQTINNNVNTVNTNVSSVKSIASTINTNVDTIKNSVGVANTAPSVTTAGGIINVLDTLQQKIQGISQYQIGATNSAGASSTTGNVMAKLNAIISAVNTMKSAMFDTASTVYTPTAYPLKTILNQTTTLQAGLIGQIVGHFIPKHSGAVRVSVTGYTSSSSSPGVVKILINQTASCNVAVYPTMPVTQIDPNFKEGNFERSDIISIDNTTQETKTLNLPVRAGDIMYFAIKPYGSTTGAKLTITNIAVTGMTTSTY